MVLPNTLQNINKDSTMVENSLYHCDNMYHENDYYKVLPGNSVKHQIPENNIYIGGCEKDDKIVLFYYDKIRLCKKIINCIKKKTIGTILDFV